ncbi:MAG: ectonucleotide pyrophosphatase/phosphodiesterase [Bacteroidota bacterium]
MSTSLLSSSTTLPKSSLLTFLFSLLCFCVTCQENVQKGGNLTTNDRQHLDKPYVILISLDGYRYDYTERFQPPHLSKFIKEGVQAESMLPCFPSKTFPNHYSIATGMYPENHGLINNTFYDPEKDAIYKISDRKKVTDGNWYSGTPIWVQAAKSGMVTASYFFVGSEANIQGIHPTYYYDYNGSVPNGERTRQVIEWLQLPEYQRPHLITMYFSDMDDTGHRAGPNDDKALKKTLFQLDKTLGHFFQKLEKLNLPINVIIVSDHGMEEVPTENYIPAELLEDDEHYKTVNGGATLHFHLKDKAAIESVYKMLKAKKGNFKIYKTKDSPYYSSNQDNPRIGELIAVVDHNYYFMSARRISFLKASGDKTGGQHGFAIDNKNIEAIFYANGSHFQSGLTVPSFENIHVYPLICEILGLEVPEEVDGKLEVLAPILKQ